MIVSLSKQGVHLEEQGRGGVGVGSHQSGEERWRVGVQGGWTLWTVNIPWNSFILEIMNDVWAFHESLSPKVDYGNLLLNLLNLCWRKIHIIYMYDIMEVLPILQNITGWRGLPLCAGRLQTGSPFCQRGQSWDWGTWWHLYKEELRVWVRLYL